MKSPEYSSGTKALLVTLPCLTVELQPAALGPEEWQQTVHHPAVREGGRGLT